MKFKFKDINKRWKEYAIAGCICILFLVLLLNFGKIWGGFLSLVNVLKPVIFGSIIAYIINPLAVMFQHRVFRRIKKEKLRWTLAVATALFIVLLLLSLLMISLIPQMVDNVISLADNYDYYVESLQNFIDTKAGPLTHLSFVQKLGDSLSTDGGLIQEIGKILGENSKEIIATTTNIGNAAFNWLIGAIFAIYFLLAKKGILAWFDKLISLSLSPLRYQRTRIVLEKFNTIFSKYIVFEILDAAIIGVSNYIFMIIMGMQDALFISMIMGITNLIPTFGPIIGVGIGGFILLLVQPWAVLPLLIFTLVAQLLDAYLIKPKLFGDALNVPGALILIGIVVFGKLMGVVGMLFAIPIVAIIVYFISEVLIPWLELKRELEAFMKEEM